MYLFSLCYVSVCVCYFSQSLSEPSCYHEFCRLLARLKANFQLGELVRCEAYATVIKLVAEFTVTSLQVRREEVMRAENLSAVMFFFSIGYFFTFKSDGVTVININNAVTYLIVAGHSFFVRRLFFHYPHGFKLFHRFICLLTVFCCHVLQMWTFAPNSIYYLLSFWQRMVMSIPYVKASEPHMLETYTPEVTTLPTKR